MTPATPSPIQNTPFGFRWKLLAPSRVSARCSALAVLDIEPDRREVRLRTCPRSSRSAACGHAPSAPRASAVKFAIGLAVGVAPDRAGCRRAARRSGRRHSPRRRTSSARRAAARARRRESEREIERDGQARPTSPVLRRPNVASPASKRFAASLRPESLMRNSATLRSLQNLARIHDPERIERRLDLAHHVERDRSLARASNSRFNWPMPCSAENEPA